MKLPLPTPAHSALDYTFNSEKDAQLIIDCGANVGESVLLFHKCHPGAQILAYEADRQIYNEQLLPNISQQAANPAKITCHQKAVWIHNQGIEFHAEGKLSGSCMKASQSAARYPATPVESIRLRDLLEQHETIDFLKIDIEGAELEVLKDCHDQLHKVDRIFIEYHSFAGKPQELSALLHLLETKNFRYRITEDYNPRNLRWTYGDNNNGMDCQLKIFALHPHLTENEPTNSALPSFLGPLAVSCGKWLGKGLK